MKTVFCCVLFFCSLPCFAQVTAVTSNGDEVILYNDGTWKYADKAATSANKIDTSTLLFSKSADADFLIKSTVTKIGIKLNPKKWSFKKTSEEGVEYNLNSKGKDAYALVLTERVEIPLENLRNIALDNAKEVAPDVHIVHEEYRVVNGETVLCLQMNGTTQGIKFTYLGYYYSFDKGTVQFVTYTSQKLFDEYKSDMEELLNGFVVLK